MIRSLKMRTVADAFENEPRSRRQTVIRSVYLAAVVALAVWLADFFFGGLLYFRSEGMVLAEPAIVAAEFSATVRDLRVREGEKVKAGQIAAIVSSHQVDETIARLSAQSATRTARLNDLRLRSQTVEATIGTPESRRSAAVDARSGTDTPAKAESLTPLDETTGTGSSVSSRPDADVLQSEKRVLDSEIDTLNAALAQADSAVGGLRRLYDQGQMRVPIDGIVSRVLVEKGSVIRAGEPLIEVHGHDRFVLAYVPTGALYEVAVGDQVQITNGLRMAMGTVARVEPLAAPLPRELQRVFTPVERQQVIRIAFQPGEAPPPLFTKVQVRSASFFSLPRLRFGSSDGGSRRER